MPRQALKSAVVPFPFELSSLDGGDSALPFRYCQIWTVRTPTPSHVGFEGSQEALSTRRLVLTLLESASLTRLGLIVLPITAD